MPDIDLGPNDYKKQDSEGRWQVPDDPRLAKWMLVVALGVLVFIFVNRAEVSDGTLFGVSAFFGACAGGLLILWLGKRY